MAFGDFVKRTADLKVSTFAGSSEYLKIGLTGVKMRNIGNLLVSQKQQTPEDIDKMFKLEPHGSVRA